MIPVTGEEYREGRGNIRDEYIQYRRGHNRYRRYRNRRDYTPFHTQLDTNPEIEDIEHISSDTKPEIEDIEHITSGTKVDIEGTMGDRRETPEGRGKGPKTHIDSIQATLNDLDRGQRDILTSIQQMKISAQMLHLSMSIIGANAAGGQSGS
jgi:hypothetical protein